ncbi:MAG: NAD-binding protein [Anaerolineales bacterium]|nr:NAD-binding protein [Anaerolineales bacterium]
MKSQQPPKIKRLLNNLRDSWLLFRTFQVPLLVFIGSISGGGTLYWLLSDLAGEPLPIWAEAVYHVLGLTFLQPIEEFPRAWYLELFYFIMPIIGIGILAQGVADFGVLFFNRRERAKEWEMAVASTFNQHIVLVGLGHLGFRVAQHLHHLGQAVAVIEINPKADLVATIRDLGIPVIADDATRQGALQGAGIQKASGIICCTQNDSLNLQVALKARKLQPEIRVVVRIFDDDFANALQEQFGFHALSATGRASPAFAAAAAGVDMTRPITVEGQELSLASLQIASNSQLIQLSVAEIEKKYDVSVVLLRRNHENSDFHPAPDRRLNGNDTLAVLGGASQISQLAQHNRP